MKLATHSGDLHMASSGLRSSPPLATLLAYFELMKPRVLLLVLFTGLPIMGMAQGGWPPLSFALVVLLGVSLAGGAANSLNCYIERDLDLLMERTRERPLPTQRVQPRAALVFGLMLSAFSTWILYASAGVLPALLSVATILFYVFVYTLWLKPRSWWAAVVGGVPGAAAPLIADAAFNGGITAAGWILFAIVLFWQPPHVWAIALYRKEDYRRANIPVLPLVAGDEATRRRALWFSLPLWAAALAPYPLGLASAYYAAAALLLNGWFLGALVLLWRRRSELAARHAFRVSLLYLSLLFAALILDLLVS